MMFGAVSFGVALLGLVLAPVVGHYYWERVSGSGDRGALKEYLSWTVRGLAAPALVWILLNSGLLPGLPPLLAEAEVAKAAGANWVSALLRITAPALLVLSSWWGAVTFAWLLARLSRRMAHGREFTVVCLFWLLPLLPVAWLTFRATGASGLGLVCLAWLVPVIHGSLPMLERQQQKPFVCYARAMARLKFGKYAEAETEVLAELEKCEDDYEGWVMLADLYANHFNELAAADQTVRDLCRQPGTTALQVSLACQRLADWHLKLADNPAGARGALEEILQRAPGTHFARMAQMRIDQLPATPEELRERRVARPLRLPALGDELEEDRPVVAAMDRQAAADAANRYVEKLKRDPNDSLAREEFARVLAEQLGQAEVAIAQLELLMELPDQPPGRRAQWLSLMAAWRLRRLHDPQGARPLLERLVREFGQTPQAFAAQRRLNLLATEERVRAAAAKAASAANPAGAGRSAADTGIALQN
ncbi:MAG: hypothetical protein FJ387_24745 [Verrucomicrobia bacterium]|nr:hypothetical protein [Verrucomicrobiota bacterium]